MFDCLALRSSLIILAFFGMLLRPVLLTAQMGSHTGSCPMCPMSPMMRRAPAPSGKQTPVVSSDTAAPSAEAKAQAAEIWDSRCAACHGAEGRGDGPGAAALKPRPLNFHKRDWQKAVTDEQIATAIVEGGGAVGLSNQMPANPDLEDETGVVKALVAHVRTLGK